MRSYGYEIKQLKKKILDRTLELQNLKHERSLLLNKLYELKDLHEDNKLSYAEFNQIRNTILNGKSIDYGLSYYDEAIQILLDEIGLYKQRIKSLKEELSKQAFAVALSFGFIIMFSLLLSTPFNAGITGFASSNATTESKATIQIYYAIELSSDLNEVNFIIPNDNFLGTVNNNATKNYAGGSDGTMYYVNFSADSNVNIDLCVRASGPLTGDVMNLDEGNISYSNSTLTNINIPKLSDAVRFTDTYAKAGENLAPSEIDYFRFWLDIPRALSPGVYNNTLFFESIQSGTSC